MIVAITTGTFGPYGGGDTTLLLRFYPLRTWTTPDNRVITHSRKGGPFFYKEIVCSVSSGIGTYPEFTLDSTRDAIDFPNSAAYAVTVHSSTGKYLGTLYEKLFVPASPSPTSLQALEAYTTLSEDVTVTDMDVVNDLIATQIGAFDSTRLVHSLASDYANDLKNLTSVTDEVWVLIDQLTNADDSYAIPANVHLYFGNQGMIRVDDGCTLTIGSMVDPGLKKVFTFVDPSTGFVVLALDATPIIRLAWWTGKYTGAVNVTDYINQMLMSAAAGNSKLHFHRGTWLTDGGHDLPYHTHLLGDSTEFGGGSLIRANSNANPFAFRLLQPNVNLVMEDLSIDGDGHTVDLVRIEGSGLNANGNVHLNRVRLTSGNIGFRLYSSSGQCQFQTIRLEHVHFEGQIQAGFHCNSVNSNVQWVDCTWGIIAGAYGIDANPSIGNCVILGGEASGAVPGSGGVTFMRCSGTHGAVTMIGIQLESIAKILRTDTDDQASTIKFIQCHPGGAVVDLHGARTVYVDGGDWAPHSITGNPAGSGSNLLLRPAYVATTDIDGATISPAVLTNPAVPHKLFEDVDLRRERSSAFGKHRIMGTDGLLADLDPVLEIIRYTGVGGRGGIRVGRGSSGFGPNDSADFYYDQYYDYPTGWYAIKGNQSGTALGVNVQSPLTTRGAIGYGIPWLGSSDSAGGGGGVGGSVTQITSKATGVTLNKVCGEITMQNASLAAGASVTFTVTNNQCLTDNFMPHAVYKSGAAGSPENYTIRAHSPAVGSFKITVTNNTAGALAEAIKIQFIIFAGVKD